MVSACFVCLFSFSNLVCLGVGYLRALLAFQPTHHPYGFMCFIFFLILCFYGKNKVEIEGEADHVIVMLFISEKVIHPEYSDNSAT